MPVQNGEYVQMSEAEIISALESEFRTEFGNDIDLTQSSVFSTLAEVLSSVLSKNQEKSLQEVYESGFLETAAGDNLNKVVAIIGIRRRPAIHATGVQRFISNSPVNNDKTIQRGTLIQTDSTDPIEFETTETATLKYIDGWEDNDIAEYAGDTGTGTFSTVSTHPKEGSYELKAGATSGDHIFNEENPIYEGTELHFDVYPEASTVPIITFGVRDVSNHYQVVLDTASATNQVRIEKVESGAVSQTIDSVDVSNGIPTGQYNHVELDWNITGQISVTLTDSNGNEVATAGGKDSDTSRWREGYVGFKSGDATAAKYWDEATTAAVSANIRELVGGDHGNVGSNSITTLPSPPAGVDTTKNLYPVGDNTYIDRTDEPFVVGKDKETDQELRTRAKESVSSGGDATHDALVNNLLNDVDGVTSVTIYENKTENDNTGTGGLPPHSFEAVVHGGENLDVAQAIFDKKALTSRDYGGAHGTSVTKTITADSNGQQFDIQFTRPTALAVSMTMDIVVSDTFIGKDKLKDRIIEYIGGTLTDGSKAVGLGVGEDVMVDEVEDIVTGENETGVIGFDMNASSTELSTTPAKTTNSNGLQIVDVGANEVPEIDPSSITINVTQV